MDFFKLTLEEHVKLLSFLGYELEEFDKITETGFCRITNGSKYVGFLKISEKNMYYMFLDGKKVCNRDLSEINFSRRKQKNIRTIIRVKIDDNNLHIDNYNMLMSQDRPFIELTDNTNFTVTKINDEEEPVVTTFSEDINEYTIIKELKKKNKKLTYKIGDGFNEYKN